MEKKSTMVTSNILDLTATSNNKSSHLETKLESRISTVEKHLGEFEQKVSSLLEVNS